MRFKVFAALVATVALMGAAVAAASATNRSSQATTAQMTTTNQPTATKLEAAASLVGDDEGTCALLRSGAVECWGNNTAGALGDGTVTSIWYSEVPVAAKGLTGARGLVTDGVAYCALLRSGGVECWGVNTYGALGDDSSEAYSDVPVTVKGLTGARSLVGDRNGYGDGYGFCAVWGSGGVKCWGSNDALISGGVEGSGLLGNGSSGASSDVPVTVKGLAGAVSLVGGDDNGSTGSEYTYCAVLRSFTAMCWGQNGYGELGDGGSESASDVPVTVKGLAGVASLEVGIGSACAVLRNGGAECWGYVAGTVPVNLAGIGP